jgi:hypothetical protein
MPLTKEELDEQRDQQITEEVISTILCGSVIMFDYTCDALILHQIQNPLNKVIAFSVFLSCLLLK